MADAGGQVSGGAEVATGSADQDAGRPLSDEVAKPESVYAKSFAADGRRSSVAGSPYMEADPLVAVASPDADAFFDRTYDPTLLTMVRHVVESEGPVLDMALARRISKAHGWQRTGSRIQDRVEAIAREAFRTTEEEGVGTFYWPTALQPGQTVQFRAPGGEGVRAVEEVCVEELLSLVGHLAASSSDDEELLVAMARELGIRRLGAAVRARLEQALREYRSRGESARHP